jgi:hypothetical protein
LFALFFAHQAHHHTWSTSAGSTSGAMEVILLILGNINVHNQFNPVDVHTTSGDVGSNKCLYFSVGPALQWLGPSGLSHPAVHGQSRYAEGFKGIGHTFGREAVLYEHNGFFGSVDDVGNVLELRVVAAGSGEMPGSLQYRRIFVVTGRAGHFMLNRVFEIGLNQIVNITIKGGWEQQNLAGFAYPIKQPAHLGGKAHIGHTVGFVDHDKINITEVTLVAHHEVGNTARGSHGNINTALEIADLAHHACAAKERRYPTLTGLTVGRKSRSNLPGELTGGHQNQGTRTTGTSFFYLLNNRQSIGQRLAWTSWGLTANVAAGECVFEGDFLDRERSSDSSVK